MLVFSIKGYGEDDGEDNVDVDGEDVGEDDSDTNI